MKYRKRPLFRIISTCVLALLAGLALAPGFGSSVKTSPLLADGKNTVDGKSAVDARPAAPPKPIHNTQPHSDQTSPSNESKGEQAPAAQPEQNDPQTGFDETTFAIGKPAENHGYGYYDAPRFAAPGATAFAGSGVSSGASSGGQTKPKRQPQLAAGNPTQSPHVSAGYTNHDDSFVGDPSDQPDSNPQDPKPVELPVASVPEPSSIALLAVGLLGLAVTRRRS